MNSPEILECSRAFNSHKFKVCTNVAVSRFACNAFIAIIKGAYNYSVSRFPIGNFTADFIHSCRTFMTYCLRNIFYTIVKSAFKKVKICSSNSTICNFKTDLMGTRFDWFNLMKSNFLVAFIHTCFHCYLPPVFNFYHHLI